MMIIDILLIADLPEEIYIYILLHVDIKQTPLYGQYNKI